MNCRRAGLIAGLLALATMAALHEPPAGADSSYGIGGAGATSVQETGGFQGSSSSTTPTSVVITGSKVLAPHCSAYTQASGLCS